MYQLSVGLDIGNYVTTNSGSNSDTLLQQMDGKVSP